MNIAQTVQERLESLVPPAGLAKAYVNRSIWGVQDFKVFDWARRTKTNLLIKGPTQSAKTLAFRAYAAERRIPAVTIDVGAALDPSLTLGTMRRDGVTGNWEFLDGVLTAVVRSGEAVAVLDECNMAHPKVMASFHPLGDARRCIYLAETGEVVKAGDGLLLAATMNPDYIGTSPLGQAFAARFQHVWWDYDDKVEKKLLAPSVRTLGNKLRQAEDISTPVSTHALMKFQDTVTQMGYDFAVGMFKSAFSDDESQGLTHAFNAGLDDAVKKELLGGA